MTLLPHHSEVEVKLPAKDVNIEDFNQWVMRHGPARFEHVIGPDIYYRQGENVLRHRLDGGPGTLTVKKRKDTRSTTDRLEIDLALFPSLSVDDVTQFLLATGWERDFTVVKDAWIFYFTNQGEHAALDVSVVIYDVYKVIETPKGARRSKSRRFIEVEIEKAHSHMALARPTLDRWVDNIKDRFSVGKPMNLSLYELYSGKKYSLVTKGKDNVQE